jgi:hypothetical protein
MASRWISARELTLCTDFMPSSSIRSRTATIDVVWLRRSGSYARSVPPRLPLVRSRLDVLYARDRDRVRLAQALVHPDRGQAPALSQTQRVLVGCPCSLSLDPDVAPPPGSCYAVWAARQMAVRLPRDYWK